MKNSSLFCKGKPRHFKLANRPGEIQRIGAGVCFLFPDETNGSFNIEKTFGPVPFNNRGSRKHHHGKKEVLVDIVEKVLDFLQVPVVLVNYLALKDEACS